jgi:predicted MFS family arabinose efflux permease
MQTLIPAVVPDEDLDQANGQLYAAQAVANDFAGPPAGSVLFAALTWIPFALNAVAWGAAAVLLAGLRLGAPSRVERPATTFIEDVVVGARWLWRHPVLRALLVWGAVVNASLIAFGSIYVLFALEVLGISEAAYGFLAAAIGLGGIAGTLVAGRLVRGIGRSRVIQLGGIAGGVVAVIGGFMTSAIAFAALMFVLTASAAAVSIVVSALRQSIVPNELLGRVHATFRVFSYGAIPLGALAGGWLANAFGLRAPYFVGGAIVLIMSLGIGRWVTDAAIERARPRPQSELAPSGM